MVGSCFVRSSFRKSSYCPDYWGEWEELQDIKLWVLQAVTLLFRGFDLCKKSCAWKHIACTCVWVHFKETNKAEIKFGEEMIGREEKFGLLITFWFRWQFITNLHFPNSLKSIKKLTKVRLEWSPEALTTSVDRWVPHYQRLVGLAACTWKRRGCYAMLSVRRLLLPHLCYMLPPTLLV